MTYYVSMKKQILELREDRLRELIDQKDMSLGGIEVQTGVSKSQLSLILSGKRSNVWASTLGSLAIYFNVSIDYLMGISDVKAPADRQALPDDARMILEMMRSMSSRQRWQLVMMTRLLMGDLRGVVMIAANRLLEEMTSEIAESEGSDIADEVRSVSRDAAASGDLSAVRAFLSQMERLGNKNENAESE